MFGAVAQKFVIDKVDKKFTEKEKRVLWFVGVTAAILPDFDLVYAALNHMIDHRDFVTHGIFIYLLITILLYLFSFTKDKKEFGRKFFKTLSICFIIGVLTHFLLDFIVGGIVFLAPFSYQLFGFKVYYDRYNVNWLLRYLESKYMLLELFNVGLFLVVLKDKKYIFGKIIALGYFFAAIAAFIFINIYFFK